MLSVAIVQLVQSAMSEKQIEALIVDDSDNLREIFRIGLEFAGYKVTDVNRVETAIQLLEKQTYHLLMLDLILPGGKSGHDLLDYMKNAPQHAATEIILVTGNAHMVDQMYEGLVSHVFLKPVNVVELSQLAGRLKGVFA
jgi:CheY-like chemotaxis protein